MCGKCFTVRSPCCNAPPGSEHSSIRCEISHYLSEVEPSRRPKWTSQGQSLCCYRKAGRPHCGFSKGESVKKGQLCPIAAACVGWVAPRGSAAEPVGQVAACLGFNLLNSHGCKQDWGFVGMVLAAPLCQALQRVVMSTKPFTCWRGHHAVGEDPCFQLNIFSPTYKHTMYLLVGRSSNTGNFLLQFLCTSAPLNYLLLYGSRLAFQPLTQDQFPLLLLELFPESFTSFHFSFCSENPRQTPIFPTTNGDCAVLTPSKPIDAHISGLCLLSGLQQLHLGDHHWSPANLRSSGPMEIKRYLTLGLGFAFLGWSSRIQSSNLWDYFYSLILDAGFELSHIKRK